LIIGLAHVDQIHEMWNACRFVKKERTFRYPIGSSKIKRFCAAENKILKEKGIAHCEAKDLYQVS